MAELMSETAKKLLDRLDAILSQSELEDTTKSSIHSLKKSKLISLLREGDFESVKKHLTKHSKSLTENYFYHHPRNPTDTDYSDEVILITTPLHEAILEGCPRLVELLCSNGANVNCNPKPGTRYGEREYSLTPLDFSISKYTNIRGQLFQSDIIKILLRYGAKREDGTIPYEISVKEMDDLYYYLFHLIKNEYNKALEEKKHFILMLPEFHTSRLSLLLTSMIITITVDFGIRNFYVELNEKEMQCLNLFGHSHVDYSSETIEASWIHSKLYNEFLALNYYIKLSKKLGMNTIPVDNSQIRCGVSIKEFSNPKRTTKFKELEEQLNVLPKDPIERLIVTSSPNYKKMYKEYLDFHRRESLQDRNEVMVDSIHDTGLFMMGADHAFGILKSYPFDPKKFHTFCINVSQHMPGLDEHFVFTSPLVHQIPVLPKGFVELWSPDEIIQAVHQASVRFQLSSIMNRVKPR